MMFRLSVIIMASIFYLFPASAQCVLNPVSLKNRVQNATYVFEGEVIAQQTLWDVEQAHILTANTIKVYKNFKESLPETVCLLTKGGTINEISELVTPSLQLKLKDVGIFTALPNAIVCHLPDEEILLQPYAGAQAFVRYDLENQTGLHPFERYENIDKEVYKVITKETACLEEYEKLPISGKTGKLAKAPIAPSITSLSPLIFHAGMSETLTITGSGFGTFIGAAAVKFRNPDFFGLSVSYQSAPANHILSWTDTQIQVLVPGKEIAQGLGGAGTGAIRVYDASGVFIQSSQQITVLYNKANLSLREVDLIDHNGNGSYTFRPSINFGANAQTAFNRALQTWQCQAEAPFELGNTIFLTCPANDGINMVAFDNFCNLPNGTLAETTQWYIACANGDAYFSEIDILFSNVIDWNYDSAPTGTAQKDFETNALHELGHAMGMGHVLDYGKLMYPALANATDIRLPDADAIECVDEIMAHSTVGNTCNGSQPVSPHDCSQIRVKLTALLEGAYLAAGQMTTELNDFIPQQQPFFASPWEYFGSENLADIPNDMVDWVLVELLDNNYDVLHRRAAYLRNDGVVLDPDGLEGVRFSDAAQGNYYIVLRHRNHLAVISAVQWSLPVAGNINFGQPSNISGGITQLAGTNDGKFALFAGDYDADGVITVGDYNIFKPQMSSLNEYNSVDCDLNGSVTVSDYNWFLKNVSITGANEIRY